MPIDSRVVVIGGSGFGRESLDVLEAMIAAGSHIEIVGVLDDKPTDLNLARLQRRGVAYLGTIDTWLANQYSKVKFVVGIGDPQIRKRIVERIAFQGHSAFTAIHPKSIIGSGATFEEGAVLCAGAVVSTNARFGRFVHINPNATIGHDAELRDYVSVNPGAVISGEVLIHSEVLIGASATVLQCLVIGKRAVVGAGSVVTKNVPDEVVVKGVPGHWND